MRIARTLHWKGELLIQSRLYHDQSPGSIPMDGNATAEASITPQWLPDSPKTGAPCGNRRTSAGGHFLRNHSLFEFVNAERLSDLIVSLLPRVLRQCALASLGQNRSTYQFAMDNFTLTWLDTMGIRRTMIDGGRRLPYRGNRKLSPALTNTSSVGPHSPLPTETSN